MIPDCKNLTKFCIDTFPEIFQGYYHFVTVQKTEFFGKVF